MKVNEIVLKTREIMRDKSSSGVWHYDDEQIVRGVVSGIMHLFQHRPESQYVNGRLVERDLSGVTVETEIDIPFKWEDGIAYYAASRCLDSDSVDTVNLQLSQTFLQRAIQEFQK